MMTMIGSKRFELEVGVFSASGADVLVSGDDVGKESGPTTD